MHSKSTKKSLVASGLSLLTCAALLVGTTFAWFTDSVVNKSNRIQAGTLQVDLLMDKAEDGTYTSIADGTGDIFSEETGNGILWEPGKTEIVYLAVQNKGSLALNYNLLFDVTDGDPGLVGALEYAVLDGAKAGDLENATTWEGLLAVEGVQTGDIAAGQTVAAPNGTLDEIVHGGEENETDYFALAVHMKENAGNAYQGGSITIDLSLIAKQATAETDGFGNPNYDENSDWPIIADAHYDAETSDEFLTALSQANEGETIAVHLKDDITLDQIGNPDDTWKYHYKISGDKAVIIDLAGNALTFEGTGDFDFTGGILAQGSDITIVNGTVNTNKSTAVYTTSSSSYSTFKNVTFNVMGDSSASCGVNAVGFTEFENCRFNVEGSGYGIFCARPTKVVNCSFKVSGDSSAYGIQMNNHCNGNIISNSTFEVAEGTAIYVNNESDAVISDVAISLFGEESVTGIHVADSCFATIGENVTITNSSTARSNQWLLRGTLNFANITIADGFEVDTDAAVRNYTKYSVYEKGTYWKTVPASGN